MNHITIVTNEGEERTFNFTFFSLKGYKEWFQDFLSLQIRGRRNPIKKRKRATTLWG